MRSVIPCLFFFVLAYSANAYEIKGKVNLSNDWQPRVYLASISSPDDLFVASPDFIVNEAFVDADGNFELSGNDLPAEPRFYRIYAVRNNLFAVEFKTDSVRNFIHLMLDNSSEIEINNADSNHIFDSLAIHGSPINNQLNRFEKHYFDKQERLNLINTAAKRDFQKQSLNKYIHDFVDSCSNTMVALFAVYHIVDRQTDFLRNSQFYFSFQDRLTKEFPAHIYTYAYNDILTNLVGYRDLVCEIPQISKPWRNWVIAGEAVVILFLLIWVFKLRQGNKTGKQIDYDSLLTDKEFKIWESLAKGMTNKEIANEMFIELSTVKTHINSLYRRLNVSNRKEAIRRYNDQKK